MSQAQETLRRQTTLRLKVPCQTSALAARLMLELTRQGVDVECIENGRVLSLPWGGDPGFAYMLAELVVREGYGEDHEVATAVGRAVVALGW